MQKIRYAPLDPTLPKPWWGLVDSATSILYFWNPETNVTTYVRPTTDPLPDLDNRGDGSQIHKVGDLGGCGDDINNDDPSQQAKRKDTNEFCTPKKQKTTSPPSVVDATEGHVEESIMKSIKVSHSVDKEQKESNEVHKLDQFTKEKRKLSEVEGEVHQSANTNGAELLQDNRSENFEMNAISSICTTRMEKEMGNSLLEKMPIVCTDMNQEYQELLCIADGCKGLGEEMNDHDGLIDQDGGPIIDMSNDNVDCLMIDSTQIEAKLEKQPINRSLAPPIDKVEEDLALTESIDHLAGVTDQLSRIVEAMRYVIQYVVSAKEIDVQRQCENEELKKNIADLKKKVADLEAKLKETMVGNQHARCQFLGS